MKTSLASLRAMGFVAALACSLPWGTAGAVPAPKKHPASKPSVLSQVLMAKGSTLALQGKAQPIFMVERPGLYHLPVDSMRAFFKMVRSAGVQAVETDAYSLTVGEFPALLDGPNKVNEAELGKLDQLVKAALDEGVGLVLTLSSDSGPAGGKSEWAKWAGSPNPNVFFLDYQVKSWFQGYVTTLLKRVNPLTGKAYGKDPAIWAWNLMEGAQNAAGAPGDFNQWLQETAAKVRTLAPGQLLCVGFDQDPPPGITVAEAVGTEGLDFVVYAPSSGDPGTVAAQWSAQTGKPVVALFVAPPTAPLTAGAAGAGFHIEGPMDAGKAETLKSAWAALGAKSLVDPSAIITKVSVQAAGKPILRDEAALKMSVNLAQAAKVRVRWGQGGNLDQSTDWKQASGLFEAVLPNLSAGQPVEYMVEAQVGQSPPVSSGRKSFNLPPLMPLTFKPLPPPQGFIGVKGDHFVDPQGRPWRYVGTNCYYLHYSDPAPAEYVFSKAAAMGMKVVRIWAFGEAPQRAIPDWEAKRYFTLSPGKYDEANLKNLDRVVATARKNGLRLILALANNWTDFGGAPQWAAYFGFKEKNDFFDKPEVQKAFRDYIAHLVNRVNTVTGLKYKDDPTIFAWDLMNEPRYERDPSGKFLSKWVDETAGYLKSLGIKQLVTTGSEGARASGGTHYSGSDFVKVHQSPNIDFATMHLYPYFSDNRWSLETTEALIQAYCKDANEALKKPVVMEEFGLPKKDPKYDRPVWVRALMQAFFKAGGDGVNYWMIIDPAYNGGDGNDFTAEETDTANAFALTAHELEGVK